jgi:hypothetical protein
MFERKVVFLNGRVEPPMLTVRFFAYPVTSFETSEDESTAVEQVDHTRRVIPDEVEDYKSWPELRSAFEKFVQRAEESGQPAVISAAAVKGRKFFGFSRWASQERRVNYDLLRAAV